MEGESVFTYNAPEKFCLVIGNEANGVSDEVKKIAEQKVSIPMQNGVESLNASVSAGILMYLLKNSAEQ
jgi:TrmH family RNA methyltransferase